jgi:hypothetical protein
MRAITRYVLASATIAAFVVAPVAHFGVPASAHSRTSIAVGPCPDGTHWDDILHICR